MESIEYFLEVDITTLRIADLKKGITLLGGQIPQGSVLKKNLIELMDQAKNQYLINKSAGNATFGSPQQMKKTFGVQDPEIPQIVQLNQPTVNQQNQDLTMNAFQITGQNLAANDIIKSKLQQEIKEISSEIKPTKLLKPPKGIERTPQSFNEKEEKVDLETFVKTNQVKNSMQQSQYNNKSSVHGSNFDFTTNFTNAELGKTNQTTISDEYNKTQKAIEDLHKDIRSVLEIASPVKIIRSVKEPSVTVSPEIQKKQSAKKKKKVQKTQQYPKQSDPHVGSQLKESDLNFSLQAKNRQDACFSPDVSRRKSVTISQTPFRSFVFKSKTSIYWIMLSSLLLLVISTILLNYINNKEILSVPIFTSLFTKLFSFPLPHNFIEYSHSLTTQQPQQCPMDAICNQYNELISCKEDFVKIKLLQSSKYSDFQFKLTNKLYNIRVNLLHSIGKDLYPVDQYNLYKCIFNSEDSVLLNEAIIRSKTKLSKMIQLSYKKQLSSYKQELDCLFNNKCLIKQKAVQFTNFLYSVEEIFPNLKEKIYYIFSQNQLPTDLQIVEINNGLFISVSAEDIYPNFSYLNQKFINFIIHPIKSLIIGSIKFSVFALIFLAIFKVALFIYERIILEKSIQFLLHLKKHHKNGDSSSYSIKSGQLMSQVFKDIKIPDFILEVIWNDVEQMLLTNKNVDCNYSRNVFGEVETAFYYGNYVDGVEWSGVKGILNDEEESTHTIEY